MSDGRAPPERRGYTTVVSALMETAKSGATAHSPRKEVCRFCLAFKSYEMCIGQNKILFLFPKHTTARLDLAVV